MTCSITPAPYNDAQSAQEIKDSFWDGGDFVLHDITSPYDGKYCSKEELQTAYDCVKLRNHDRKLIDVIQLHNYMSQR